MMSKREQAIIDTRRWRPEFNGPQLRELLGVIRTQELIEARKLMVANSFSRANDFDT
jgi:hypothetical protein